MKNAILIAIVSVLGLQANARIFVSENKTNIAEKQLCSSAFHSDGTPQGTYFSLRLPIKKNSGCALGETLNNLTTVRISNLSLADSAILLSKVGDYNSSVVIDISLNASGEATLNSIVVR